MSGYLTLCLVLFCPAGTQDVSVEKPLSLSGIVPSARLGRPSHRILHAGPTSHVVHDGDDLSDDHRIDWTDLLQLSVTLQTL